jgi:glutathione S-transferase
MTPTITAFERSPDRGRGLARDMRVRWALEEVGQPYEVRLVSFSEMREPAHLALHPFGQIPTYQEGDLALFESGAIVLHIAERHAGLLPDDANERARAIVWMFAALNTVEPPLVELTVAALFERDKPWCEQRLPLVKDRARKTLGELSRRLGDAEWLDGAFTAGDLLMGGAIPVEGVGNTGRVSEPLRLCGPWRSAARLQACLRGSIGGVQAVGRLRRLTPPVAGARAASAAPAPWWLP